MTLKDELAGVREDLVHYLRRQYLGPANGELEVLQDRPDRIYLVGTLFPRGQSATRLDGDELGEVAHDDELDEPVELANAWQPASAAISFFHDGDSLSCTLTAGVYASEGADHSWAREPLVHDDITVTSDDTEPHDVFDGRARLVVVWRPLDGKWLVTAALENKAVHDDAESQVSIEDCLFQVHMSCTVRNGVALPYPTSTDLSDDPEDQELRLLYRDRRSYGTGHGCSVSWRLAEDGTVRTVTTDMLPTTVVPAVRAAGLDLPVLRLERLADEALPAEILLGELRDFVHVYGTWVQGQAEDAEGLQTSDRPAAERLVGRMRSALRRMLSAVDLLGDDADSLLAFRLANAAMREQMLQSRHVRDNVGRRGQTLAARAAAAPEPRWHPFQLGFQLLSLASTAQAEHVDRQTVDLLWFPTGGGKTEAYLGLAAFEMIRRRLTRGVKGGGTAVLTRYTLRLLTTQQFQRSATLICSLERLRHRHPALLDSSPFSIGMWVGGDTTPNNLATAHKRVLELRRTQTPESPFQIQSCPWCGTPLLPRRRVNDAGAYGVRSTQHSFELFCTHDQCPFHPALPVSVVDEQIFAEPPTLLVATVDKFARLPWVSSAGSLFGQHNVSYDPPGLVIQDELHLLSGPLGTTVALYESAVQSLIGWGGQRPKIVASTATIRAADHQIRSLYGAPVNLFPPSGLTADNSFFAEPDPAAPGRLYLGLMPQAHSPSFATVLACVALLQGPLALGVSARSLDAYWTLVAYHNSLRELGRTVTIARDDVESMLQARDRGDMVARSLRRDGVIELTSNVSASQLPRILERLEHGVERDDTVDVVATTNMLSVGIDISRLGLMLMNGQPKTTSEYIQATSRVGRSDVPGLVVTLLRASKPRDRSHYEGFLAYHQALYRHVEPTSVTPWSLASRRRSLHAALTLLVRHGVGLRQNDQAGDFRAEDPGVQRAVAQLNSWAQRSDPDEAPGVAADLQRLVGEWDDRARAAEALGMRLKYESSSKDGPALLCDFGEKKEGWETMHSMRSVDRQVRVLAIGETLR
ncbi:helicase [Modestobacter sp. L9-4]|uniref:helicase-related protein n=1 Tax=Modestobacter sp. L9-4 TaxID=2851567 RepID=UPI001C797632|nr:helicase-related protein [Modestobacter sp. L9-4]QXG76727.1 helicase [Modestobacter sp. L9-4]